MNNTATDNTNITPVLRLSPQVLAWVRKHGSPYLRFCVAEGIWCPRLYNEERAWKEAPGWSLLEEMTYQPLNPPEEAMDLLFRARERFPQAELRVLHRDGHDEYVAVAQAPWPNGHMLVSNDRIVVAIKDD